jgi:hypothetical protein
VTNTDPCRFCRIYAIAVVAFAALVGAVMAAQMGFGLRKLGGHEYIMRVVALSTARSLAPAIAGSALLLAFVVWAHPLPVQQLQTELPRFIKRGLLVTLPGYAIAAAIALCVGTLVSHVLFGVPWAAGREGAGFLLARDGLVGAISALTDAALICFLAWRYLPRLQAGRSSLPMKLVIAWTFGTGLRMTVGLLVSMLLPG